MSATFHGCKYKIPLPDHQWRMGVPVSGRQSVSDRLHYRKLQAGIDNVFLCSHGTRTERCPPHQALPRVLNHARTRVQREREAAAKATGTSTNRPSRPVPHPVGAVGPGQLSCNDYGFVGNIIRLIPLHETVYPEVDSIASTSDNDNNEPLEPEVQIAKINTEYLPYVVFSAKGRSTLTLDNTPSFRKVIHLLCCLPPV
ncbi:hypothetical protein B0H13DRAFT_1941635 [Mycena leptocephala]|nr:hypothetical protein B0H13DRAFT_1941635 [Mycena leptocephala]